MTKNPSFPYRIFPLGDSAITIDFGNYINEDVNNEVIARYHQLKQAPLPGMIEAVPAYSSLTIHYDLFYLHKKIPATQTVYEWMKQQLEERMKQTSAHLETEDRLIKIPVCYDNEFAMDMQHMSEIKNISTEEIIAIHTSTIYKIFMLGFLPGFAYMGKVDEKIAMCRKQQPVNIEAGSVGIAGKQTGIYPLTSPGGWQVIGRTPLKLFDSTKEEPALLRAGDKIQFYSISKQEFESY